MSDAGMGRMGALGRRRLVGRLGAAAGEQWHTVTLGTWSAAAVGSMGTDAMGRMVGWMGPAADGHACARVASIPMELVGAVGWRHAQYG